MKVLKFRKFERNTLKGFAEIELPSGMIVKDITWHERDGKEWIGLPARKYEKEDGSVGWSNQVDFVDKDRYWNFVNAVLAALKAHVRQEVPPPASQEGPVPWEEEEQLPF